MLLLSCKATRPKQAFSCSLIETDRFPLVGFIPAAHTSRRQHERPREHDGRCPHLQRFVCCVLHAARTMCPRLTINNNSPVGLAEVCDAAAACPQPRQPTCFRRPCPASSAPEDARVDGTTHSLSGRQRGGTRMQTVCCPDTLSVRQ